MTAAPLSDDEPTVTVAVIILGFHVGCTGEVAHEAVSDRNICLACGTVDALIDPGALDFEITEDNDGVR